MNTDSPEQKSGLPRPESRRRVWIKRLAILGLPLLALGLWLFVSPDEPPPDVGDLTAGPPPPKLPDNQNAYAFLIEASALVRPHLAKDHEAQFDDMAKGKNWDAALARQWLGGTEAVWPLWEQTARTPQGQAPLRMAHGSPTLELRAISNLGKLAQIRAWDLARNGQPDAAMESLFTALQVAQRLEQSRGHEIYYHSTYGLRSGALESLRGITTEFKPSAASVRQALRQVEAVRPDKAAFADVLRQDFQRFSLGLDNPEKTFVRAEDRDKETRLFFTITPHIPRLFKLNKTRWIYAEIIRHEIRVTDLELGSAQADGRTIGTELLSFEELWNIGGALEGVSNNNLLGRILASSASMIPKMDGVNRLKAQSNLSATEAFIALVLYHREHGELPATFDALVPDYLPAVPRDYFDGQPIRYSREFRAVWSVGSGHFTVTSAEMENVESDEIYLPLNFAAPAAKPPVTAP